MAKASLPISVDPYKTCSISGCDNRYGRAKGGKVCKKHWHRMRRHGDYDFCARKDRQIYRCIVDGCEQRRETVDYCAKHWYRVKNYGDPSKTKLRSRDISKQGWVLRLIAFRGVDECWEWQGSLNVDGYGILPVKGKPVRAHRLAWHMFTGNPPPSLIMHTCDNRKCCNLMHLREGTVRQNSDDKVQKGRQARSETMGAAKLTEAVVNEIRQSLSSGVTGRELSRKFQVTEANISAIKSRKTWKHI